MDKTEQQKSLFLNLYCMILADGNVDARELETLYRIGRENYGLSDEAINKAVMSAGTTFFVPEDIEARLHILYEMALIAWADGNVDDKEKELLRRYALRYEVEEDQVDDFIEVLLDNAKSNVAVNDFLKQFS